MVVFCGGKFQKRGKKPIRGSFSSPICEIRYLLSDIPFGSDNIYTGKHLPLNKRSLKDDIDYTNVSFTT